MSNDNSTRSKDIDYITLQNLPTLYVIPIILTTISSWKRKLCASALHAHFDDLEEQRILSREKAKFAKSLVDKKRHDSNLCILQVFP